MKLPYRLITILIIFTLNFLSMAQETTPEVPKIWQPEIGATWQWQLTGEINTSYDVDIYDIDLFDSPQAIIDELHDDGRIVICYFSAGTFEDWRPDVDTFPEEIIGEEWAEWAGESYLDIRQLELLQPIMSARLDLAVEKNCDGVEPDNVDIYYAETGFPITAEHQLAYNIWLAEEAHARGLSIGLKNDGEQAADLVDYFDWALVEQCFYYDFCEEFAPFTEAGKVVFGVEYIENGLEPSEYCPEANELGFSWLTKSLDLDDSPPNVCFDYPD